MRLILVRHGQTTSNVAGALDTATPGAELTELGREQAAALPAVLARERLDAIVVSTLVRTQQTAAPLAAATGIEPIVRAGIREVEAGTLEMKSDRKSVMAYLTAFASWATGDLEARMPGAENGHEAFDRFDAVVAEFAHHQTLLIVSHGAMIRYWAARAASNIDGPFVRDHILSNTGVVVLNGSPTEGWIVESWLGLPVGGPAVTDLAADGPTD
ncbi:histidine phosphatase family protein [Glaciihabitans arcticus]|uniref:Histidine phosphatase family protein n=1 Tax=Glaciihabitans arcticus TaxID=2668039 RepID=A0A4Q9H0F6_9MICO|nr:histidine phosphatase family protein [Glaciihabitans arcticus]TBN58170.1 histidine phosphatase family protein [Glaciihabitans arcticus]